jgi:divalent metal cation (Fe/Co/Zn/Cd) transporter
VTTALRDEAGLRRRGLQLAWFIIVWDVIEGIVAVTAGLLAGSIALVSFGIDSAIEVFAASIVVWQLRGGGEKRRGAALRLIAPTFFLLAIYVSYEAIGDLISGSKADPSPLGLGLNVVALAMMVPVAIMQGRTGRALDNDVLVAQAQETWISNALSVSLLIGLGANALFGWWWADPVAALLIALVAVYSGIETWREANE